MADANLAALYQEMILDHYRRPRNKGELEHPDAAVDMKNPLCGDEIGLQMTFDGETISDLKFTGRGCSISQASASMMTELVKGKNAEEAEQIREVFRAMVMGNAEAAGNPLLGKARSLSGVAKYPARVKCALLGWNALESGIRQRDHAGDHQYDQQHDQHRPQEPQGHYQHHQKNQHEEDEQSQSDAQSQTRQDDVLRPASTTEPSD